MSEFERNIVDIFDATGKEWLNQLPKLVAEFKQQWDLQEVIPFSNLTYSYVGRTAYNSKQSVLKLMPPCERFTRECEWYRNQGGRGSPNLLECDEERGSLLIERLQPATSAKSLVVQGDDQVASVAIAESILNLEHRAVEKGSFPHVKDFAHDLKKLKTHVPETLLSRAIFLLEDLTKDTSNDVLLHGDLHHDNVLNHGDHWVAIDPHGYIGPGAFEVGAMMRNPYDCFPAHKPLKDIITSRVDVLNQKLPFSRYEILAWSLIYTLVASSWSLKDHGEVPADHIEISQVLAGGLPSDS